MLKLVRIVCTYTFLHFVLGIVTCNNWLAVKIGNTWITLTWRWEHSRCGSVAHCRFLLDTTKLSKRILMPKPNTFFLNSNACVRTPNEYADYNLILYDTEIRTSLYQVPFTITFPLMYVHIIFTILQLYHAL